MTDAATSLIDRIADWRIPRRFARLGACVVAIALFSVLAVHIYLSKDYILPAGSPMGGDYSAFWTAAHAMAAGDAVAIYEPQVFFDWLNRIAPAQDSWTLTWQYPPTMLFAVSFLALLPFGLGYAVWSGGGLAIFALSARAAGLRGDALLIMLAAPVVFHTTVTGQNGFLTASLLLGACLAPKDRPILAGLCAALLTMKPQLGLLVPIAYIAGGCWRAFAVAAIGSLTLAALSVAAFGIESWTAFVGSVVHIGGLTSEGVMQLFKMPTPYAAFIMAGLPKPAAMGLHLLFALAAVAATVLVWRRSDSKPLRALTVCVGTFLATPFGYYYELVIIAAPLALLAVETAQKNDWRRYDHLLLAALFYLPILLPGETHRAGLNVPVFMTLIAFYFTLAHTNPAPVFHRAHAASS